VRLQQTRGLTTRSARIELRELVKPAELPHNDWVGNIAFALGLTLILLGVTLGALGNVSDLAGLAMALVGIALLALFVVIESREASPMLDLSLFRIREFTGSATATLLNALARGAFTFVLVFYLQGPPRYLDAFTAGLFLIPTSASLATVGPLSGYLSDRYGPRWLLLSGLVVSASGFLWLSTISSGETFWQLAPALVLVGGGMGLFAAPNRAAMMTAVPPSRRGVASGVGVVFVNTGATISLGITLIVMSQVLPHAAIVSIFLGSPATGVGPGVATGFLEAIHIVFLASAALILLAIIPSFLRDRHPLPRPAAPPPEGD
jgi:MFS family permease